MSEQTRVLVVDDDEDILAAAKLALRRHIAEVVTCQQPESIPELMQSGHFAAILLDLNFSPGASDGREGFAWLKKILSLDQDAVVVVVTAHAGINIAVEAMKRGANDFIAKPWNNDKLVATLSAALKLRQSRAETASLKKRNQALIESAGIAEHKLLGKSQPMRALHHLIFRTAPTDANVLILGENGTGKELVAREIHRQSARREEIFLSVDLGAIAESVFESELFGHKKGAFTGADKDRTGRLVAAHGGTLFLDEIGNIPRTLQAKLLTVLERRQVTPLGSNEVIDIDVRLLAATNMSRDALSEEQQFRQDLLFRLNTVEINLPPLRHRGEDILEVADYYARYFARKYRREPKTFSNKACEKMLAYNWPGNVRALRHSVERAVILSEGDVYQPEDLQLGDASYAESLAGADKNGKPDNVRSDVFVEPALSADLHLDRMEKRLVEAALRRHGYNISQAAKALGITRAALYRRMEKHEL